MKTLLIDGNWNLKRNFMRLKNDPNTIDAYKTNCGGVYGFLLSLQAAIKRTLPDRVVVMWDGILSGKLRYEFYKPYKANRKKEWDKEVDILAKKLETPEDREEYDLLIQKMKVKNLLEELFVRQLEIDYIEGDDLIAYYILKSSNEEIIIFSRDKDFRQLVSENVSLLTPDSVYLITKDNFKEKVGHTIENELLIKCFEGDSSDDIRGVNGIKGSTLKKYFPDIVDRKYTFQELSDKCNYFITEEKWKLKTFTKIIESRDILYRNAKLMNLKKPFLSEQAKKGVKDVMTFPLDLDRSIQRAILKLNSDGYVMLMRRVGIDVNQFFAPFYGIISKEKVFRENYVRQLRDCEPKKPY